jgi:hypothetical protein
MLLNFGDNAVFLSMMKGKARKVSTKQWTSSSDAREKFTIRIFLVSTCMANGRLSLMLQYLGIYA